MKRLKENMMIEDMALRPGERFLIENHVCEYVGVVEENGNIYDQVKPIVKDYK